MIDDDVKDFRIGHDSVRGGKSTEKNDVVAKALVSNKAPKTKVALAKTVPLVLSFSEGAIAGTIKFVSAGDSYQDNTGKVQRYSNTKVVIKTTNMKDAFTITEPLYRFMMLAFQDEDARSKIAEWVEEE